MYQDITGIILAGGKSSRMGQNKSLMQIDGVTLIERTVHLMKELFPILLLSTNSPLEYEFLKLEMVSDVVSNVGPLAGIYSTLLASKTEKNFIISCDMPLMTRDMVEYIINSKPDAPIKVAKADGFVQQLCGLYSRSVLSSIEEVIAKRREEESRSDIQKKRGCPVLELVRSLDSVIIDAEAEYPDYKKNTFFNLNKPEDYNYIVNYFSGKH
jgi:molybdopterin-guanine dinucleotide biosynthesis protein A